MTGWLVTLVLACLHPPSLSPLTFSSRMPVALALTHVLHHALPHTHALSPSHHADLALSLTHVLIVLVSLPDMVPPFREGNAGGFEGNP